MHPAFGFSLRKASFTVALLDIIIAAVCAIFYILGLTAVDDYTDEDEIQRLQSNFRIPFVDPNVPHDLEDTVGALKAIFSVGLVSCLFMLGFGALLFVGVRKGNQKYIKIWIIFEVLMIAMAVLYVLAVIIQGTTTMGGFVSDVFSILTHSYFCWIVYSHFLENREEQLLTMTPSIAHTKERIDITTFPL